MNFNNDLKVEKITIGLPVFNGEKFIQKKIESLLSQTFTNFKLIISDNASTDSTSRICKEFESKDNRIQYFRQKETIDPILNFYYILEKTNSEFFLWTAVDDVLHLEFLEKNLEMLEKNEKYVCSISKIRLFGPMTEYMKSENSNITFRSKLFKKIYKKIGYQNTFSVSGNYENRIKEYIKNLRHNQVLYSLYRTNQIKESFVKDSFLGNDAAITFNLLKYGEIHVIDEILMEVFDGGMSRSGMIHAASSMNKGKLGIVFPFWTFTKWCIKNLGKRIFLKNVGFFIRTNLIAEASLFIDILRRIKHSIL